MQKITKAGDKHPAFHLSRRNLLLASAGSVLGAPTVAESSASSKKLVWSNYTQAQLDDAYNQKVWAPDLERFVARFSSGSERTRSRVGMPKRLTYGKETSAAADFFTCGKANAPVFVFVHGGAWRLGSAEENAFIVEPFLKAGIHVLIPDFPWVQDVNGSLYPIVAQLRKMMQWLFKSADGITIDKNRFYVGGHSSGCHLAAVLLTTDWTEFGLAKDLIKGGLCSSGMFDLIPVSLSARRKYVNFTKEMVEDFSPIRHLQHLHCPLVITSGSFESPEFKRQGQAFIAELKKHNKPYQFIDAIGYNHFEVLETLANPFGELGAATLDLINN